MSSAALKLATQRYTAPAEDPLAGCTDEQRAEALARLDLIRTFTRLRELCVEAGQGKMAAYPMFAVKNPGVPEKTLYNWMARYKADGLAGLVDRRKFRDTAAKPAPDSCSPEAWSEFLRIYLTLDNRGVAACHQFIALLAEQRGWHWPAERTVQVWVQKRIPLETKVLYREGEKAWRRRFGPKLARNYDELRSNECWVGDFHIVDVFIRRSDKDATILRARLSTFMDMRSRMIVGWHLTETEDSDGVVRAFAAGCRGEYGPCARVVVDNGKPYRAAGVSGGRPSKARDLREREQFLSVFKGLGVEVHFSIPFNPDSKPVERWFRTFEEQCGKFLPGYCSGDNSSECFKAAHRLTLNHPDQLLTFDALNDRIGKYIVAYNATRHEGVGMNGLSPAEAMKAFDPIKTVLPHGALDMLLRRVVGPVKVTCQGVRHQKIQYGEGLDQLRRLVGQEVLLRVDAADAGYVVVCDLQGVELFKAFNNRLLYTGSEQQDVKAGRKRLARAKRIAKEVEGGALRPLLQDISSLAIEARMARGTPIDKLIAATGTNDSTANAGGTYRAVRSDLAGRKGTWSPPPPPPPVRDFVEAMDSAPAQPPATQRTDRTWEDIA